MDSSYWHRYWTSARTQKPAKLTRPPRESRWLPSTIGKGESEMNYWQRQEAVRGGQLRRSRRRAA